MDTTKINALGSIALLVIEDNPDDINLIKLALEKSQIEHTYKIIDRRADFLNEDFNAYDLIFLDYSLIDFDGLTAVKHIREHSTVPIIVLSGTIDQLLGFDLLEAGADEFLHKSYIKKIPFFIKKYLVNRPSNNDLKKDNHDCFEHIFDNLNEPVFVKNLQREYIRVNEAFLKLYGEPDLLFKTDAQFVNALTNSISTGDHDILETGKRISFEFEFVDDEGKLHWYNLSKNPVKIDNKTEGIFGIIQEITDRKLNEASARKTRKILVQAEEMTNSGSFEYDKSLEVITCSKNLMLMLGIRSNTISLSKLTQAINKEDQELFLSNIIKAVDERKEYKMQHRYNVSGREGTFEIWLRPNLEEENVDTYYGTVVDTTPSSDINLSLINLYEERRSEITKELHDNIGQKLQGVSMYLDKIKESKECSEFAEKALNILHESMDQLDSVIARNSPNQIINFSLKEAVENLTDLFPVEINVELEYSVREQKLSDHHKLQIFRILQEAINNIIKHSRAKNVTLKVIQERSIVGIHLIDDGIGFDSLKVSRGNGLSNIVHRVKACNGLIKIDSKENSGTEIVIKMPMS